MKFETLLTCGSADLFWMELHLNFDEKFQCFFSKDFSWDWFFIQINLKIYFETFFFRTTKQGLILTWNLKLTYGRSVLNLIFLLKTLKMFYVFLDKTCRLGVCLFFGHHPIFLFWHKNSGRNVSLELKLNGAKIQK